MTDLLEHPLILKYFGPQPGEVPSGYPHYNPAHWTAYKVLRAMQEPIKRGDLYLFKTSFNWEERRSDFNPTGESFHPFLLRLPEQFQRKDEVEEKIQLITGNVMRNGSAFIIEQLHELVRLAREK